MSELWSAGSSRENYGFRRGHTGPFAPFTLWSRIAVFRRCSRRSTGRPATRTADFAIDCSHDSAVCHRPDWLKRKVNPGLPVSAVHKRDKNRVNSGVNAKICLRAPVPFGFEPSSFNGVASSSSSLCVCRAQRARFSSSGFLPLVTSDRHKSEKWNCEGFLRATGRGKKATEFRAYKQTRSGKKSSRRIESNRPKEKIKGLL